LESADPPDQLSSSGRAKIVGTLSQKCPEKRAVLWIKSTGVASMPQKANVRLNCTDRKREFW